MKKSGAFYLEAVSSFKRKADSCILAAIVFDGSKGLKILQEPYYLSQNQNDKQGDK